MFFKSQLKLLMKRNEFIFTFLGMTVLSVYVFVSFCMDLYHADTVFVLSADKTFILRSESNQLSAILPSLIPFLIVLPFADSYISDKQGYILPCLRARVSGKNYYYSKMVAVALSAGAVVFIPFLINYLLSMLAFPKESLNYSLYAMSADQSIYYSYYMENTLFPALFVRNPYGYNLLFLVLLTVFCMLCAIVVYALSYFISNNRILILSLAFIINNFIIILSNLISSIEISPFSYLIALENSKPKSMVFLFAMFGFLALLIIILSPRCIEKLNNVEGK